MIKRLPPDKRALPQAPGRPARRARRDLSLAPQAVRGSEPRVRARAADGSGQRARHHARRSRRDPRGALPGRRRRSRRQGVDQHTRMLRTEPFKYDSYKALARIYRETNQYDKYWCLCSTLAFLKKADADEHAVLRAVQAARPRQGQARDDPGELGQARARRREPLHLGDPRRVLARRRGDERFPAQGLRRQARGPPPAPHRRPDVQQAVRVRRADAERPAARRLPAGRHKAADIQLANAIEKSELCPSFVVRPHLLQGKTERELAFLAARRLAFMRPSTTCACCCRRTPSSRSRCSRRS